MLETSLRRHADIHCAVTDGCVRLVVQLFDCSLLDGMWEHDVVKQRYFPVHCKLIGEREGREIVPTQEGGEGASVYQ